MNLTNLKQTIKELTSIEELCHKEISAFEVTQIPSLADKYTLKECLEKIIEIANEVHKSWSKSYIGYHANVYYENFAIPPRDAIFSFEWGLYESASDGTEGDWVKMTDDEVIQYIIVRAGKPLKKEINNYRVCMSKVFEVIKNEFKTTLEVMLTEGGENKIQTALDTLNKLTIISLYDFNRFSLPHGSYASRDSLAVLEGPRLPPHIQTQNEASQIITIINKIQEMGHLALETRTYLQKKVAFITAEKNNMNTVPQKQEQRIFIGHGHSLVWRVLKDFLKDKLHLEYEEFDRESPAGLSVKEKLVAMMNNTTFAFLVLTAEDIRPDGKLHPRDNVIHECGLFQGKFGFEKAIILVEEDCADFSNIHGLIHIPFSKGKIDTCFEKIRDVLEREKVISS